MNTFCQFARCAGALLLATTLQSLADDQIRSYTVPKEHPAIPVNSAPITWTTPAGWEEKPPDDIRLASFAIKGENAGKAEVAITSFPGTVGTELANVNRWRGELALAPIEAGDVSSEPVTVDSVPGKLYDMAGASARTVVADILRNGKSWFIKMRGDTATVAANKPAFLEFLKSVHFGDDAAGSSQVASVAVAPDVPDPHSGLGVQGAPNPPGDLAPPEASPDTPKWNVPAQWAETGPRAMVLNSFAVSGDAGAKAEVTISRFQGEAGGVLANANRWRGQIGLAPLGSDQLDGITEALTTLEGKATLVDFMGTDAKTGQPARLVAAIVPHGGNTWFYKLMGNGKVVGGQKDSFVQFVKTVHYP